jgi:hypothetical protein
MMARRFGRVSNYEEWCEPILVENTLDLLDKEIPKLKNRIDNVQLCFMTDPFMYGYDDIQEMSLNAIRKLNDSDIPCTVLSKGVLPIELGQLSKKNVYGITLISLNELYRYENEPGSAPYEERIKALKALSDEGYKTWVSMEPYPTPNVVEQDIQEILKEVDFVDRIIFGRTNYNSFVSSYPKVKDWYNERVLDVVSFCMENEIDYCIKQGTWTFDLSPQDYLRQQSEIVPNLL